LVLNGISHNYDFAVSTPPHHSYHPRCPPPRNNWNHPSCPANA